MPVFGRPLKMAAFDSLIPSYTDEKFRSVESEFSGLHVGQSTVFSRFKDLTTTKKAILGLAAVWSGIFIFGKLIQFDKVDGHHHLSGCNLSRYEYAEVNHTWCTNKLVLT